MAGIFRPWTPLIVPPELSGRVLERMLPMLVAIDRDWLETHPKAPLLYESGVRYQAEPPGEEKWLTIPWNLLAMAGDCLPIETLVLREDLTFAPIAALRPGDRIMGDGAMTTVQEMGITGIKPILGFELDNGSILRTSPEHRVFLADGREVRAEAVKVGDRLRSPSEAIPGTDTTFNAGGLEPVDLAWLVGAYIADGWSEQHRFSISGFDDAPKRGKIAQKERVQAICEKAGIDHRWLPKHVRVNDPALNQVMQACGTHAPDKAVPFLRAWSREQVEQLILGLQADCSTASSGTMTHGTTSPMLALQLRVLYRMLGQSVHIRRWDDHGGLGTHPIYRVTVRRPADEDTTQNWKTRAEQNRTSTRVRAIREEPEALCADITTDSGRFYLPESDTIVHNCEDLACWRVAELQLGLGTPSGQPVEAHASYVSQETPQGTLYHIQVTHPDGRVEDPCVFLGMGWERDYQKKHGPLHGITDMNEPWKKIGSRTDTADVMRALAEARAGNVGGSMSSTEGWARKARR